MAVVLASFVAAAIIARPLWIPIVLGGVMAISATWPYRLLCPRIGPSWAAGVVTIAFGLLVATAGSFVVAALTNELMKLVVHLNEHGNGGSLDAVIGPRATRAIDQLGLDTVRLYGWLQHELEAAASFMAEAAAIVVRTTSQAVLGLVISLMTMYYALREGPEMTARLVRTLPLEPAHTRALIAEAREVGRTAFIGTLATAVIQGALAGVGFAALGVPQPVTWAVATTIASFVPLVGTVLVWGPVAAYLVVEGHPVRAVILVVWGVLVVTSLADYVIRPRIVGRRGHGHPLLTLIALLGGLEVFGLAGLVIAPIIMSLFVAALRLYEREAKRGELPA